jgi:hypothetical protein
MYEPANHHRNAAHTQQLVDGGKEGGGVVTNYGVVLLTYIEGPLESKISGPGSTTRKHNVYGCRLRKSHSIISVGAAASC